MNSSVLVQSGDTAEVQLFYVPAALTEVLPEKMNQAIHADKNFRQDTVIRIKLDAATCHGQEIEALEAAEIRQGGLSLATLADLHQTLTGISPQECVLQLETGAENTAILALFAALLQANGLKPAELKGMIGASPLEVLLSEGTLPLELNAIYGTMAAGIRWAVKNSVKLDTILVKADFYLSLGFNFCESLALCLAEAMTYQLQLAKHGIDDAAVWAHLEIMLPATGNTQKDVRLAVCFRELMQELQDKANAALPLFALSATADNPPVLNQAFKQQVKDFYRKIMEPGDLAAAIMDGTLPKLVVVAQNRKLAELAEPSCLQPQAEEKIGSMVVDTAYLQEKRMRDIAQYQKEIDELEKNRALVRVVKFNTSEQADLIDKAKEAFFAGASLADVVIALHNEQNDCYLENTIDCHDLQQRLTALLKKIRQRTSLSGKKPVLALCSIGLEETQSQQEAELWSRIFAPAGLNSSVYDGNKQPETIAEALIKDNAYAALLLVPQGRIALSGRLAHELRRLQDDIKVFVAEAGATAHAYEYPMPGISYLTADMTTCLCLADNELI